jgi:hypothetical protein
MTPRATLPEGAATIASALRIVSLKLHRTFSMNTQPGRFRIQKTVYLLGRAGYRPAQRFGYNLYLKGPHSPDLARAYYALGDAGLIAAPPATDLPESVCQTAIDALNHDDDFLEALSTALSVSSPRAPFSQAVGRARAIKPHFDPETWGDVERFQKEHPRLIRRT